MDEQEESKVGLRGIAIWKQVTAFITLLSVMPILFAINGQYVGWHDDRYPLRSEVMLIAELTDLQQTAQDAQDVGISNSAKLDFLIKAEAAKIVREIQLEIALHNTSKDDSALWRRNLVEMEGRLNRAQDYKECVVEEKHDCDAERIW